MIDRTDLLSIDRKAKILGRRRGTVDYLPQPVTMRFQHQ
jgi:hypothetical protein